MITLVPHAGLANRMRAIFSAVQLAKDANCPLRIVWNNNSDVGADFTDLFALPRSIKIFQLGKSLLSGPLSTLIGLRNDRMIYSWIQKSTYDSIFKDCVLTNGELIPALQPDSANIRDACSKRVLVQTCFAFYDYEHSIVSTLEPNPLLLHEISRVTAKWKSPIIGVHVRRCDHSMAINQAPIGLFVEAVKDRLARKPSSLFYLATDCEETQKIFVSIFGDRVVNRICERRRDSIRGMQDSLIDLYLLSKCTEIYGSPGSSFSAMASILGSNPLTVLKI